MQQSVLYIEHYDFIWGSQKRLEYIEDNNPTFLWKSFSSRSNDSPRSIIGEKIGDP
jgi:hypothetical protein